jgi:CRP-like cAMP-binding protein
MLIVSALSILPSHHPDRVRQHELSTPSFMSFKKNAMIYWEGEPADHLYTVTKGSVRTCKVLADGRRQICAFYLPGDTFGVEMMSEHNCSAEAVSAVDILAVNSDAAVASQLLVLMGRELDCARNHVLLLVKSAPQRMASFLLEMAERIRSRHEVELPMSRQDIARLSRAHDRDRLAHAHPAGERSSDCAPHLQADCPAQSRDPEAVERLSFNGAPRAISTTRARVWWRAGVPHRRLALSLEAFSITC